MVNCPECVSREIEKKKKQLEADFKAAEEEGTEFRSPSYREMEDEIDFEGLGFYLLGENDEVIETEHMIDVGDIGIGYATVYHGVAPVNTDKDPDWDNINDGRWFLSLYSNQSDEVKSRHTSTSVTSKLEVMEKDKKRIIPLGDI